MANGQISQELRSLPLQTRPPPPPAGILGVFYLAKRMVPVLPSHLSEAMGRCRVPWSCAQRQKRSCGAPNTVTLVRAPPPPRPGPARTPSPSDPPVPLRFLPAPPASGGSEAPPTAGAGRAAAAGCRVPLSGGGRADGRPARLRAAPVTSAPRRQRRVAAAAHVGADVAAGGRTAGGTAAGEERRGRGQAWDRVGASALTAENAKRPWGLRHGLGSAFPAGPVSRALCRCPGPGRVSGPCAGIEAQSGCPGPSSPVSPV